ncbi:MAG: ADP-ribosylglycohydrolase family protein [Anaerolineae bacterium]|nr:ADP-ribosylglycohydrolase family protein [Anaerolineae bacterium]
MVAESVRSKIRGCVLGAALGDAIGGPFEFQPVEMAPIRDEKPWIDGLYPYTIEASPHGVWAQPAPAGTGTDDTRYNWLFLELVTELGEMLTPHQLATCLLRMYQHPESAFPDHTRFTRLQFEHWEPVCCGFLGLRSVRFSDLEPDELLGRKLGLNFPILSGLITLTSVGLLFPGQPEVAYRAAFRTDFFDIGYAREAVALLAAILSLAVADDLTPKVLFDRVVQLDPLHLGSEWSQPFVKQRLTEFYPLIAGSKTDQGVAHALSVAFQHFNTFDAFRTLGVAFLSVLAANGDPVRSILIAANHVGLDNCGFPMRFEDIDCYAGIAGAIAGAIAGDLAFPPEMLSQVIQSNKDIHGIDLDDTISRFIERLCSTR